MAWFDAGVNVFDQRLPAEATLAAAAQANVTRMCLITTHPDEWAVAESLYQQYPHTLCYTLGVHPHHAKDVRSSHWAELRRRVSRPGVVAIGECGLDYNRDFSPRDVQQAVFKMQIELACELNKPLYLHERDAFDEQCACLQPYLASLSGGIAHCFTGTPEQMHHYLSFGLYIGVTGWVCDPKRGAMLQQAVTELPLERLVLETDAPYLYPKTLKPRKRDNSPAYLPHVGLEVAVLKGLDVAQVEAATFRNSCLLFK
ncbi:TatD family hydrolase [Alteromonas gilva]|uniref:TatD family hydrolase n=1 Tax=Alteromonas gilva TaxID=2987522 RepID=A0ABT5L538_9ALTE|nr:TatD family hydrolase [Alteromonas gilva]MDC8832167.1 TatD family hydrolase [Alteromonas gilva]